MQGICLIGVSLISFFFSNRADTPANSSIDRISKIEIVEFIGSFDLDDNDNIVLRHFPDGNIKPAIIYIHPCLFQNNKNKYKAYNYLDRNVKVKGSINILGDKKFIFVESIELLITES
jgi:hypothetical protein